MEEDNPFARTELLLGEEAMQRLNAATVLVAGLRGRERHVLGSLSTIPGIFGLTLANEAIRFLVNGSFAVGEPQTPPPPR